METRITARHFPLSEDLKEFTVQEVERLNKYFNNIIDCHFILDVEKYNQIAELNVKVYGTVLTGKHKSSDIRTSIEKVVDKLERQLKKYNSRLKEKNPQKIEEAKNEYYSSPPVE